MWWRKCGLIWPPPWKGGDISGRRCRTWPPMVTLEPAWKDASIDTSNSLIRGLWGPQNYFWLNWRYIWPPKSDTAADGLIETAMTIRIFRDPIHLDRRTLRLSTPFWHKPPLSRQIDRSKRAAAVRYCGDFNTVILSPGAALYDLHLVNGSEENYFQAN